MYKRLYIMGIGAYIFMFVLSVLFYKERIILLDTAFTLFHIVKDHSFCIQVYRFGDVCSQLFPVLAVKAGLPLDAVIRSYSVGFMAYYFLCYFICGSVLKQYDFALVVLLLNILFVTHTFYWITSQLPESLALLMVLLAFISRRKNPLDPPGLLLLFAGFVTLAFFHPISAIVLVYCIIYFYGRGGAFASKRLIYTIAGIFIMAVAVKATFFHTPYERNSLSGMKNFITLFPDYFTLFSNKRLLVLCGSTYYWMPVLFLSVVLFYSRTRRWKELLIFLTFFLGYLLLVNVSYATAATPVFYIESMYLPLSVFLAVPFVFELLPMLELRKLAMPAMAIIMLTGCARIYTAHSTYVARHSIERRYLDKYADKKVIAKATAGEVDTLQMLWGTAYECLLLSSIERHKTASIIIDEDPARLPWPTDERSAFLVYWDRFPYSGIDRRYFAFTDTVTGYTIAPVLK